MKLDFVIIGGMKCSSTAVGTYFSENPKVNFCNMIETDFFSHNNNKIESLELYFKTFFENKPGLKGESSPTYSYPSNIPSTPQKLKQNFPDLKVILIVRNPINRVESHINHLKLDGYTVKTVVKECLKDYPDIIDKSRFGFMVDEYIKVFGKDNFMVVKFEDILEGIGLEQMCNFVGVEAHSKSLPIANKTDNRYIQLPLITFYKRNWLKFKKIPGFKAVKKPLKDLFDKSFSRKLLKSDYVSLSQEEIVHVKILLQNDIKLFKKHFDFDLFELRK